MDAESERSTDDSTSGNVAGRRALRARVSFFFVETSRRAIIRPDVVDVPRRLLITFPQATAPRDSRRSRGASAARPFAAHLRGASSAA